MTQKGTYLIPKTETVQELKNEFPSFEEFKKNYQEDKHAANIYEAEYQDMALYGPQYGPGNVKSSGTYFDVDYNRKKIIDDIISGRHNISCCSMPTDTNAYEVLKVSELHRAS